MYWLKQSDVKWLAHTYKLTGSVAGMLLLKIKQNHCLFCCSVAGMEYMHWCWFFTANNKAIYMSNSERRHCETLLSYCWTHWTSPQGWTPPSRISPISEEACLWKWLLLLRNEPKMLSIHVIFYREISIAFVSRSWVLLFSFWFSFETMPLCVSFCFCVFSPLFLSHLTCSSSLVCLYIVFVVPFVFVNLFCTVLRAVSCHPICLSSPMLPHLSPSFLQCLLVTPVWNVSGFGFLLHTFWFELFLCTLFVPFSCYFVFCLSLD